MTQDILIIISSLKITFLLLGGGSSLYTELLALFSIHYFRIDHNASCSPPPPPPKFCITIVSNFSWVYQLLYTELLALFSIHYFRIDHNASCSPPPPPPKFCITIVSNFSWVYQLSQEKSKTMVMQNFFFGGGGG